MTFLPKSLFDFPHFKEDPHLSALERQPLPDNPSDDLVASFERRSAATLTSHTLTSSQRADVVRAQAIISATICESPHQTFSRTWLMASSTHVGPVPVGAEYYQILNALNALTTQVQESREDMRRLETRLDARLDRLETTVNQVSNDFAVFRNVTLRKEANASAIVRDTSLS
jgi:hypothetical protein